MTKKLFLLLVSTMALSFVSQAQWKLTATSGITQSISNKPDSLLFAKKTGLLAQINIAHYWGRLGLGIKGGTVKQKGLSELSTTNPPNIQEPRTGFTGGGVQSTYILLGPEICLCYKDLKIMPTIKLGVVNSKTESDTTKIIFQNGSTVFYRTEIEKPNSLGFNIGINLVYKVSQHIGIALNADYLGYKVQTALSDFRTPAIIKKIKQPRQLLNLGLGIYYNL